MERMLHGMFVACLMTLCAVSFVKCQTPVRWQQQVEPQAMGCNQQLQRHITMKTNLTMAAIDQFKTNYTWHKFDLGWGDTEGILDVTQDLEFLQVCNEQEECMRVLPQLPSPPFNPPSTRSQAGQQMAELLEYSQQYAYALEILFLDQSLHEDSFQAHVDEIYRQWEGLVSAMIWGLKQCEVPARDTTLRGLMGKVYRGADTVLRDQRAFRTIRQCHLGLHYIRHFFSLNETHPLLR